MDFFFKSREAKRTVREIGSIFAVHDTHPQKKKERRGGGKIENSGDDVGRASVLLPRHAIAVHGGRD